ncbi:MAG TPA: ABC-F family ATP-binding cassette domain-containing protein [Geobacterales bacterium]|nr:ABC-F family ATP-binding cassette domain-containing protein [Geobacterales bacterium]
MLHLQRLSMDFAGRYLLRDVTWHLRKGERVGLVGDNGTGKSTLLKIVAGLMEPTAGGIQLARGTTVGYLPQDGVVSRGKSLFDEALSALVSLKELERENEELSERLATLPGDHPEHDQLLERLGTVQEEFRQRGGYTMEAEVAHVLAGLGFTPDTWQKDCGTFSGGWQMRIALARLLLMRPGVLLLDEPTNHLDIEARNWLEEYLRSYPYAVIVVAHDRFFLDQVCQRIVEVWNGTLTDYHCSYSRYLVERQERLSALREAKRRQDEEVARIEDFISRFRYKADKAPLVQSRLKQLEKIERIELPPERKEIRFRFPTPQKSGRIVMELAGVSRSYGSHTVLNRVSLTIERGERVALVGHNGAGKSTLMSILAGGAHQEGERRLGHNVTIDYFAQDQASVLHADKTVLAQVMEIAPFDMVPRLRDLLGAFLFTGDDVEKKVAVLSGGERNRLALCRMLLKPANLLLLDEPTNHLDLTSKDILLNALEQYDGTVVFVSHDRHFVDHLATRVVEVADGRLTSYIGDYEYYLAKKAEQVASVGSVVGTPVTAKSSVVSQQAPAAPAGKDERLRQREADKERQRREKGKQKRLTEIEAEIEQSEAALAALEGDMALPTFFADPQRARQGGEEHERLTAAIARCYAEWEELQQQGDL